VIDFYDIFFFFCLTQPVILCTYLPIYNSSPLGSCLCFCFLLFSSRYLMVSHLIFLPAQGHRGSSVLHKLLPRISVCSIVATYVSHFNSQCCTGNHLPRIPINSILVCVVFFAFISQYLSTVPVPILEFMSAHLLLHFLFPISSVPIPTCPLDFFLHLFPY
jgi:hypothetical protein